MGYALVAALVERHDVGVHPLKGDKLVVNGFAILGFGFVDGFVSLRFRREQVFYVLHLAITHVHDCLAVASCAVEQD